jgi:diacylglycerol kinase (ATP)
VRRILKAAGYSFAGFKAALSEASFRQEVVLSLILIPVGLYLGGSGVERALLIGSVLLVLVVELLNSAIEAVVDRVSLEHHSLSKRAKDVGSAAVALALVNAVAVWLLILV